MKPIRTRFWRTALLMMGIALFSAGCQATIGNMSFWARPAVSIPPRAVKVDDGAEYRYVERYDPRGDSVFIMVRIYPKGTKDNQSLFNSKLRKWPEQLLKRFKDQD